MTEEPWWKLLATVAIGFVVLLVVAWLLGCGTAKKAPPSRNCIRACLNCPCVDAGASAETPPGSAAR